MTTRRKLLTSLALAPIAAPAILRASSAKAGSFLYAETNQLIDGAVPITTADITAWRWIHRLQLPPLLAGDVLQVHASGEIRHDYSINTEFATQISLTPGWPYYHEDLWSGSGYYNWISAPKGENINQQRHYYAPDLSQLFKMPVDMPVAILNFRIRCRSYDAQNGVMYNTIMGPGYGKLSCLIHRA